MDLIQIIVLSLVQGISEFLPVSSSAHLVLVPKLLGWSDQGMAFDVAVHVGTLAAIIFYFKDRIFGLLRDFFSSIAQRRAVGQSSLVWAVGFATIPAGLAGLAFGDYIEAYARDGVVIAVMTMVFGVALYFGDRQPDRRTEVDMTIRLALVIGAAQALALIPGVSRSGITMTAALFLGFDRTSSANFSFLMSIPVILLAGGLEAVKVAQNEGIVQPWGDLAIAAGLSAVSAYVCVKLFMNLIARVSMTPFVIYRLILGAFLLFVFL